MFAFCVGCVVGAIAQWYAGDKIVALVVSIKAKIDAWKSK